MSGRFRPLFWKRGGRNVTTSAIQLPSLDSSPISAPAPAYPTKGFVLLLLVTAALFVRPGEIIPAVEGWSIYEALILATLVLALPRVARLLTPASLSYNPINLFVLMLLPVMMAAPLLGGRVDEAINNAYEFSKALVYYLLVVAILDSSWRIRIFWQWLLACTIGLAVLPLLHYHGIIDVPALRIVQDTVYDHHGDPVVLRRLAGAGLFADPNDLSHILNIGIVLCLFGMVITRSRLLRLAGAAVLVLFAYVIFLTHSRGGFIALMATVLTLFYVHYGWRRTVMLGVLAMPLLLLLFAGRQTELTTSSGTGQARIQLWSDALVTFRANPVFGIGRDNFAMLNRLVVHNSFLHSFVEMGVIGGTLFAGAFYLAVRGLHRLASHPGRITDQHLRRFGPYLLTAVIAYAVGMMFLSRSYVVPTYLMLGLAAACLRIVPTSPPLPPIRLSNRLLKKAGLMGVLFILAMYIFVRLTIRW
jgi:putative inorganic carbon (hco3(-)) transporter